MVLPLFASGHGTEMLDARFEFTLKEGAVKLTITADFSGNPMLANEAEARAALADALRVKFKDGEHKLSDLAPLNMELGNIPDPESPMPRAPVDPSLKHELVMAHWSWVPTAKNIEFTVPRTSNQTVLFWMNEPGVKEKRWSILISGDSTPVISVPESARRWLFWAVLAGCVFGGIVIFTILKRC